MSTLSIAAPTESHGFVAKAGALAVGTALAGAALFGGAAAVPTIATGLTGSVQQDYVLTATPSPEVDSFVASLQNLLDALKFGNMGEVLALFGTSASPINASSDLSALLANLNPSGATLDAVTGGIFSTDISKLLADVNVAGPNNTAVPLGTVPIDTLLGAFIGGTGADQTIGSVLTALGFGPFVGLMNLPFLGLSPTQTVGDLLDKFLGISSTTTLDSLVIGNGQTLGGATIGGLLGISSTDLSESWDKFVSGLTVGGTIIDPNGTGVLGDETLGALLTSLLGPGSTTVVSDTTTVTDFLSDLGIFHMLGLS